METNSFYNEILTEHNLHPEHKHELPDADFELEGINPSCGDEITLELQVEDGKIKDASFTGVGCAISQASTSLMIDLMKGKTVEEAQRLAHLFMDMIKRKVTDDEALEDLDEAMALKNISNMPARVKCAVLAWHTLDDALQGKA